MSAIVEKRNLTTEIIEAGKKSFNNLTESREEALEVFQQLQLPGNKHEEYRFTPIARYLERNFDAWPEQGTTSGVNSVDEFLIAGLDAYVVAIVNGVYSEKLSRIDGAPFKIESLKKAVENNSKELQSFFGKEAAIKSDAFTALNTATWSDGVFIHIAKGSKTEKPVLVLQINDTATPLAVHSRIAVLVEEGSKFSLIEKFHSIGDSAVFSTLVEEIVVEKGARFDYYKIQNDEGKSLQVCNTMIHQHDASHVNTFTLTMNGKLVRNNFSISIDGENCESHFHGLYLLNGETLADNHTVVDHRKPNSFSNELYKGVMDDRSKGVFNGKIYVRPDAQKTNAFQSNRNILLSDQATVNTKPQLEIWADDVKCSHGCTTGQLDEEAIFYLRSRGIPHDMAKAMLLYAFASEVVDTIPNAPIKTYIDQLVSERLHKNF